MVVTELKIINIKYMKIFSSSLTSVLRSQLDDGLGAKTLEVPGGHSDDVVCVAREPGQGVVLERGKLEQKQLKRYNTFTCVLNDSSLISILILSAARPGL